jgi:hypothetical protein
MINPKSMIVAALPGVLQGFLSAAAVVALIAFVTPQSGCVPPATAVQGIIDIVDGVCTIADAQPEPAWVQFICTVASPGPGVAKQYTVRVPKSQADEFGKQHAPGALGSK